MDKEVKKDRNNCVEEKNAPFVSVEQFAAELMRKHTADKFEDAVTCGYHAGWLEEQDVSGRTALLERKTAARILHQFMRLELKETDADHTAAAFKLQDLYDCRRCVRHVVQVYAKGIMDGKVDHAGRFVFGMGDRISVKEMQEIVNRFFHADQRENRMQEAEVIQGAKKINEAEALQYLQADNNVQLIDVRPEHEFQEKHMKDAKNIPFAKILKNPYLVSSRRDQCVLLYCEGGYQSEAAANCLIDAGYENVLYFAWII